MWQVEPPYLDMRVARVSENPPATLAPCGHATSQAHAHLPDEPALKSTKARAKERIDCGIKEGSKLLEAADFVRQ